MPRANANLLLVWVSLICGSAFVAESPGMVHAGPMTCTGVRFLISALVVSPLMGLEWQRVQKESVPLKTLDGFKIMGLGYLLLLGVAMQQISIAGTTAINGSFLTALYVPLVPVFSWIFLRKLSHWSVWPGALACIAGVDLLSGAQNLYIGTRNLWGLASTIPWTFRVLPIGRVADRVAAPFLKAEACFGLQLAFVGVVYAQ